MEKKISKITRSMRSANGSLAGLLARSVVVFDENGTVTCTEPVPETTPEPDYDNALTAARNRS